MSWCRAPLWDLRPDITSCRNVAVSWEDGSVICSVITQWSESLRTRNHTLLSHLRLPQPGGPGSRIYVPQEPGGSVIPPSTGFPLRRLLGLAVLWWRYSNPPPTWRTRSSYIFFQEQDGPVQSHVTADGQSGQSISMSRCLAHSALKGSIQINFNPTSGGVH
jgi:hypothetical protein